MTSEIDSEIGIKWYLSYEILYFEYEDVTLQGDYLVWENLILIEADSPEKAYNKAIKHGKLSEGALRINDNPGYCKFKGLRKLIPIYEEIEDGCEIEWREYEISKKALNELVTHKKKLQAFQHITDE